MSREYKTSRGGAPMVDLTGECESSGVGGMQFPNAEGHS